MYDKSISSLLPSFRLSSLVKPGCADFYFVLPWCVVLGKFILWTKYEFLLVPATLLVSSFHGIINVILILGLGNDNANDRG